MTYATRLLEPADLPAVRDLLGDSLSIGSGAALDARLAWFYEGNPAGAPRTVVGVAEGVVVGCGSLLPRTIMLRDERHTAGLLCDFAVSRSHRSAGLAVQIQRHLVEVAAASGCALMLGAPNDKAVPIFKRVGYHPLGHTTRYSKPLRLRETLDQVLASGGARLVNDLAAKGVPARLSRAVLAAAPFVAAAGSIVAEPGVGAYDRMLMGTSGRYDYRFEPEPSGLDGFDARVPAGFGMPVRGTTSDAAMRWRYCTLTPRHQVLTVRHASGGVAAYAVMRASAVEVTVAELRAEDAPALRATLAALSHYARLAGVRALSIALLGGSAWNAELRTAGFWRRPERRAVFVQDAALPDAERSLLRDPANWCMLEGELDI